MGIWCCHDTIESGDWQRLQVQYLQLLIISAYLFYARGERGGVMDSAVNGEVAFMPAAAAAPGAQAGSALPADDLQSVDRIRTEFPETWLWMDAVTG